MAIERELLIYASLPYKKFRWVSYLSLMQVGFVGINLMVLPNTSLIQKQNKPIEEQKQVDQDVERNINGNQKQQQQNRGIINRLTDPNSYKGLVSLETTIDNIKENPLLTTTMITCSTLIVSAVFFYAKRSIHTITLLPNEKVKFQFFSPFAMREPSTLVLPLRNVSCKSARKSKQNYSILKLKGYRGYHLVHKAEGYFLEPKLYDKYLGYERSWSK